MTSTSSNGLGANMILTNCSSEKHVNCVDKLCSEPNTIHPLPRRGDWFRHHIYSVCQSKYKHILSICWEVTNIPLSKYVLFLEVGKSDCTLVLQLDINFLYSWKINQLNFTCTELFHFNYMYITTLESVPNGH